MPHAYAHRLILINLPKNWSNSASIWCDAGLHYAASKLYYLQRE